MAFGEEAHRGSWPQWSSLAMRVATTVAYIILFLHQPVQSVTSTLTTQTLSSAGICPDSQDLDAAVQSINEAASNIAQRLRLLPQCGGGYWYEVLDFDVNMSNQTCPPGLTLSTMLEGCGMDASSSGSSCNSSVLPIDGIQYSRVCGRATGRVSGATDGFSTGLGDVFILLEDSSEPIWLFISSPFDPPDCPCDGGGSGGLAEAIGNNYFCEFSPPSDPRALWTGENCSTNICCFFNSPPYFTVDLSAPTTENFGVLVCGANTVIQRMQLFVQ